MLKQNLKPKFITIIYGWNGFNFNEVKLEREEAKKFISEVKKQFPMILVNGIPIPSEITFQVKKSI